ASSPARTGCSRPSSRRRSTPPRTAPATATTTERIRRGDCEGPGNGPFVMLRAAAQGSSGPPCTLFLPVPAAPEFVHLHSEYSILDGACRIPALAARAAELEMPAVGLTDHGSLAGAVDLFKAAKQH